ncbi:MAG: hypothetical protein HC866_05595 [Leptolyngbyaceae cyanobacterium RU_5_1]|nr:hypothetical protein [Leptolyngbyaceae cyanobacterium RU_5_1]
MVNVGLGWSSFVGIALAAAGLALYFLRSVRPKLARDHDIFFAAVALLCGGILFFQGWRQDPILQFGQFLLTGSAIFFAVESIRLRSAATEQARRSTPIVDDERPVSRSYQAELDELGSLEERLTTRRIRGTRDTRSSRDDYRDEYDEGERRRSAGRTSVSDDRYGAGDQRPRRRPRPSDDRVGSQDSFFDDEEMRGSKSTRNRSSAPPRAGNQSPSSNPRRPRPPEDSPRSRDRSEESRVPPSEYVDYRPVNNDEESDNWGDE